MPVTGKPIILLGMVTAPPGPLYPVMVIVLLLIVYANWAFTTAGSTQSIVKKNSLGQQANPVLRLCSVLAMQRQNYGSFTAKSIIRFEHGFTKVA
jgi:hypothetical protein